MPGIDSSIVKGCGFVGGAVFYGQIMSNCKVLILQKLWFNGKQKPSLTARL